MIPEVIFRNVCGRNVDWKSERKTIQRFSLQSCQSIAAGTEKTLLTEALFFNSEHISSVRLVIRPKVT